MFRTHQSRKKCRRLVFIASIGATLATISSAQTDLGHALNVALTTSFSPSLESSVAVLPEAPSLQPDPPTAPKILPAGGAASANYVFATPAERRKSFLTDFIGPAALIGPAFQATADQTSLLKVSYPRDGYPGPGAHPEHGAIPEWSEGFNGYTKRYASRVGMGLIGTASRYGIGELLRQDVTYHPCQCTGIPPRSFHAITQAFVAHTASGHTVPSVAALVSPFVAAEVATVAWYPARYNASDALLTSTLLYISLPLGNLLKEWRR